MGEACSAHVQTGSIRVDLREVGFDVWIGFIWLRTWTCEHGNEPSGSMRGRGIVYKPNLVLTFREGLCSI
jgi:hypothetical protein